MQLLILSTLLLVGSTVGYHVPRFAGRQSSSLMALKPKYGLASRVVKNTQGYKPADRVWSDNSNNEEVDYPSNSPKKFGLASRVLKPVHQKGYTPKLSSPASVTSLKQKTSTQQGKSQQKYGFAARVMKPNSVSSTTSLYSAPSPAPTFMDNSRAVSKGGKTNFGLSARVRKPGFIAPSTPASYSSIPSSSSVSTRAYSSTAPTGKKNYGLSARVKKSGSAGRPMTVSSSYTSSSSSFSPSPVSTTRAYSSSSSASAGNRKYGLAARVRKPSNGGARSTYSSAPSYSAKVESPSATPVSVGSSTGGLRQRVAQVKTSQKKYGIAARVVNGAGAGRRLY